MTEPSEQYEEDQDLNVMVRRLLKEDVCTVLVNLIRERDAEIKRLKAQVQDHSDAVTTAHLLGTEVAKDRYRARIDKLRTMLRVLHTWVTCEDEHGERFAVDLDQVADKIEEVLEETKDE